MPLVPVPGPTQLGEFAHKLWTERGRKQTAPQLVMSYANQEGWLAGDSLNVRASVRVTNMGKRLASQVAIRVPTLVWSPNGANPERDGTGGWSLGLRNQAGGLDWTPQELAPDESRFGAVAQIQQDALGFLGGAHAVTTFKENGILKVRAVLSWADLAEPAAAYKDEYEFEIRWLKGAPVPEKSFKIRLGLVPV